ncbi:hypothetical protein OY671_012834, partial [Metschnikowia pulcherrima]
AGHARPGSQSPRRRACRCRPARQARYGTQGVVRRRRARHRLPSHRIGQELPWRAAQVCLSHGLVHRGRCGQLHRAQQHDGLEGVAGELPLQGERHGRSDQERKVQAAYTSMAEEAKGD